MSRALSSQPGPAHLRANDQHWLSTWRISVHRRPARECTVSVQDVRVADGSVRARTVVASGHSAANVPRDDGADRGPTPGQRDYRLIPIIDPNNEIPENNETDNRREHVSIDWNAAPSVSHKGHLLQMFLHVRACESFTAADAGTWCAARCRINHLLFDGGLPPENRGDGGGIFVSIPLRWMITCSMGWDGSNPPENVALGDRPPISCCRGSRRYWRRSSWGCA